MPCAGTIFTVSQDEQLTRIRSRPLIGIDAGIRAGDEQRLGILPPWSVPQTVPEAGESLDVGSCEYLGAVSAWFGPFDGSMKDSGVPFACCEGWRVRLKIREADSLGSRQSAEISAIALNLTPLHPQQLSQLGNGSVLQLTHPFFAQAHAVGEILECRFLLGERYGLVTSTC